MAYLSALEFTLHQAKRLAGRKDSFAPLHKSKYHKLHERKNIPTTAPDMIAFQYYARILIDSQAECCHHRMTTDGLGRYAGQSSGH